MHRLWPNEALPGELAQILPTPAHFEQAAELVTEDMIGESVPCGPDPDALSRPSRSSPTRATTSSTCSRSATGQDEFFAVLEKEILPEFG